MNRNNVAFEAGAQQPAAGVLRSGTFVELVPSSGLRSSAAYSNSAEGSTRARPKPSRFRTVPVVGDLGSTLFDSRASAKLVAAKLSMHLSPGWRAKIFAQFDDLLDPEEWSEDDQLLNDDAVRTFLRLVIYAGWRLVPSLGISNTGNLIASWRRGSARLVIECAANDRCRLVITDGEGDDRSIVTFTGVVSKAKEFTVQQGFSLDEAP